MNMEEIYSDDALVEQIRLGDEKAAEELIRRYYTSVLRYCKRQCFNHACIFHLINGVIVPDFCFAQVLYIFFDVKGVLFIIVGQKAVLPVLRNVKLIGEKRSSPSKLHDALTPIHDCNLILAHKLFATLSSEEFILFVFSYTESCRCCINVLN